MFLITFGTRPEWIKVKPIIEEIHNRGLEHNLQVVKINQHTDLVDNTDPWWDAAFEVDIVDNPGGNRLDNIVASTLTNDIFNDATNHDISAVMVQGDTTSTFAVALKAFHNKIPVVHLEAGLRTYSTQPYPEEFNRRAISVMAEYHLAPTQRDAHFLLDEKVNGFVETIGNTVLDNLVDIDITKQRTVLITMHRSENLTLMPQWFQAINQEAALAKKRGFEFIFPMHPNPVIQQYRALLPDVKVIDPLQHVDLVDILASCAMVITDSGGIQEEASFLGKPVIVCRQDSERMCPASILCKHPGDLERVVRKVGHNNMSKTAEEHRHFFGDGHAAKKAVDFLELHGLI